MTPPAPNGTLVGQLYFTYSNTSLINDSTAIWFFQQGGQEIHLLEYYENSGEALTHYLQHLNGFITGRPLEITKSVLQW